MTLLLCDVDGVLADFTGGVLEVLRERCARVCTREQVTQWSIRRSLDLSDTEWRIVTRAIAEPKFARRLQATPAVSDLCDLMAFRPEIDIQFVTSPWRGSPTWCHDRTEWLEHHFGQRQGRRVTFTAEKHQVAGDFFVDDNADAVAGWVRAQVERRAREPWQAFVWDAPYNRVEGTLGERVSSFADVLRVMTRGGR